MKRNIKWFIFGALAYSTIEIIWRGHTHWTMAVLGGTILVIFSYIEKWFYDANIVIKAVFGSFVITILELISGLIINDKYNLNVWSYNKVPYNIDGQICPRYTFFWFLLSIAAFYIIEKINEKKLQSFD